MPSGLPAPASARRCRVAAAALHPPDRHAAVSGGDPTDVDGNLPAAIRGGPIAQGGDGNAQLVQAQLVAARTRSIWVARSMSSWVIPPLEWVLQRNVTVRQRISMSG